MQIRNPVPLLKVRDVPKSIAFYKDALGAAVTRTFPDVGAPEWVHLEAGDLHLMLLRLGETDSADLRDYPFYENPTVHYLMVDDVDEAHRTLKSKGYTVSIPADMHYDTREFCLKDPDGHQFAIGQFTGGQE